MEHFCRVGADNESKKYTIVQVAISAMVNNSNKARKDDLGVLAVGVGGCNFK